MKNTSQALTLSNVYTVYQLKAYNAAAGYHFFDPSTMRFFSSRVSAADLHHVTDGIAFITSERDTFTTDPRGYTLRLMKESGNIDDISEFQEYSTLSQARAAMRRYLKEDAEKYRTLNPAS
jgi:hypothetical protein